MNSPVNSPITISVTKLHISKGTVDKNPVELAMEGAGLTDVHANAEAAFFRMRSMARWTADVTGMAHGFLLGYSDADQHDLKRLHEPFVFELHPQTLWEAGYIYKVPVTRFLW